jgi:hypothetical protein
MERYEAGYKGIKEKRDRERERSREVEKGKRVLISFY